MQGLVLRLARQRHNPRQGARPVGVEADQLHLTGPTRELRTEELLDLMAMVALNTHALKSRKDVEDLAPRPARWAGEDYGSERVRERMTEKTLPLLHVVEHSNMHYDIDGTIRSVLSTLRTYKLHLCTILIGDAVAHQIQH